MTRLDAREVFAFAEREFTRLTEELRRWGLHAEPGLTVERGEGTLCYFDRAAGKIVLSIPDIDAPIGKLQMIYFRRLFGNVSERELVDVMAVLIPRLIAHELGHYFRERAGLFGDDLWLEEQIANQLASAATKAGLSEHERLRACGMLERALGTLQEQLGLADEVVDSYDDLARALGASGAIDSKSLQSARLLGEALGVSALDVLGSSAPFGRRLHEHAVKREETIREFNDSYTANVSKYFYYQLGWMLLDLKMRERSYVEEVVRLHFGKPYPLLPLVDTGEAATADGVLACYAAHRRCGGAAGARRYFYKRYRATLLRLIGQARSGAVPGRREDGWTRILEDWDGEEPDNLDLASRFAPAECRMLFPSSLAAGGMPSACDPAHLPCETDRRILAHAAAGADDEAAANLLHRLSLLEHADLFRPVPAEALVEIAPRLVRVPLQPGESIISQGGLNQDVFLLVAGELEVTRDGTGRGTIAPGQLVGEMAFFSGKPRSATVRSVAGGEVLALKAADFRRFASDHPSVILQMARVLVDRLS